MRLIHLSDLHFGAVDPGLPAGLHRAIRAAGPDLVAVSGDLTQRAWRSEFREARAFLAGLPEPLVVVPGNHDVQGRWRFWERFVHPFRNYRNIIDRNLETVWRGADDRLVVLGVNSARAAGWYLDWSRGRLSRRQMRRMAASVAAAGPGTLRVLVVHHPPAVPPGGTARHLIGRLQEFTDAVATAGIDLVLAGHFHNSYAMELPLTGREAGDAGTSHPAMAGDGDPRQDGEGTGSGPAAGGGIRACVLSCVSTATSHRLKGEPNGFHVIDGDAGALTVEDWAWDGSDYRPCRTWGFRAATDSSGVRRWQAVGA